MKILVWLPFLSLPISIFCQDKVNIKFGNLTSKDFGATESPLIDSNTDAVILADIGSTEFIGNENHRFSYVYKRYSRIKIINNRALALATIEIRLSGSNAYKDKLSDVKAVTYILENGKIAEATLSKADLFEDKLNPHTTIIKFTLPSVKAGSIIEYSYTINSPRVYHIPTWVFQYSQYPCLYSEYKVVFPNALKYRVVRYGLDSFSVNSTSVIKNNRYTMGDLSVTSNDIMGFWVMKDVHAFTDEKFINSPNDYLDKIDFFLAQAYNGKDVTDIDASWESVTDQLLRVDYFGAAIDKENTINLSKTAEKITESDKTPQEWARDLYYYVRDNFTCIPDGDIYLRNDLYDVNKMKKGNIAEINLLLTALLRQKGIAADPVILSTVENGKNPPNYPVLDKMNYVICMTKLAADTIYLDASRPELGFGKLPIDCYNGHARIISKNGGSVYFSPAKIQEQRNTSAIFFNNEKGKLGGSFGIILGPFESEKLRKEVKASGEKKYLDNLKSGLPDEAEIERIQIDSLSDPEFPAIIHFEFKLPVSGDVLYFNPLLITDYNKNPFLSEERKYPVTLPYPIDDLYTLNMEIPEGYAVEELPKPVKVAYNGNEGFFEYILQADQSRVQLRSHIKLNEVVFQAEDYKYLRDFFGFIIKKYNEPMIFKKKK